MNAPDGLPPTAVPTKADPAIRAKIVDIAFAIHRPVGRPGRRSAPIGSRSTATGRKIPDIFSVTDRK